MPRSTRRFVKITGLAAIAVSLSGLAQATADVLDLLILLEDWGSQ